MSVDLLRRAAETLRERAKTATPGPWTAVENFSSTSLRAQDSRQPKGWTAIGQLGHWRRESNAAYIATMHPGVGLALADWLDAVSNRWTDHMRGLSGCRERTIKRANATGECPLCKANDVARAILGEDS